MRHVFSLVGHDNKHDFFMSQIIIKSEDYESKIYRVY